MRRASRGAMYFEFAGAARQQGTACKHLLCSSAGWRFSQLPLLSSKVRTFISSSPLLLCVCAATPLRPAVAITAALFESTITADRQQMSPVGLAPVVVARPTHLRLEGRQHCPTARHVWVPSRRCRRLQLSKGSSGHASRAADLQSLQQQQLLPDLVEGSISSGCSSASQEGDANSPAAAPHGGAAAAPRTAQQQEQQRQQEHQQQPLEHVDVSKAGSSPTVSSSSSMSACEAEQPPEIGVAPHVDLEQLASGEQQRRRRRRSWHGPSPEAPAASAPLDAAAAAVAAGAAAAGSSATADAGLLYPPSERTRIRNSWNSLMRWSRYFRYIMVDCMMCKFLGAAAVLH